jgi:hypothetical protein
MTGPFAPGRRHGANAPGFAEEDIAANAYISSGKPRSNGEREADAAIYRKPIARLVRPPDPARRKFRRERARQQLRADDRRRDQMDEQLVDGRHVWGRILRRHPQLCRQGRGQLRVVICGAGEIAAPAFWPGAGLSINVPTNRPRGMPARSIWRR